MNQTDYNEHIDEFINKSTNLLIPKFVPDVHVEFDGVSLNLIPEFKETPKKIIIKEKIITKNSKNVESIW